MNKIKTTFTFIGQLIINPIKKIASIPVSDRFIEFINKHLWLKLLIALILTSLIFGYYYYLK